MGTKKNITTISQYSFLLLWGTTCTVKLTGWESTKSEMALQSFPIWMERLLLRGLPAVYISLILLLIYKPTVRLAIKLSTLVISIFTLYLLVGATRLLGYAPCACAGIWPTNNHWLHIALNSLFIILGLIYWILAHRSQTGQDIISELGRKEDTVLS
ncbi:MauE/DoxX family redox-associated membrane protein [Sphingobacterium sp.]|uniref:MauE/DoxX family redox-associated membrane protein n=1 Tax=Sphingobacterium sp. TaxID=341027 RepID=UPI0025F83B67|nr:MauE/DoxX family redox-associated membrane protein [Sphingobacterium sp.]